MRVLTWRTLARIARTPEQLLNVTVQPLVFVLLFSYVFNGAIVLPVAGSYRDYLIAGIVAINMGGTAQGAAIGLAVDLSSGLVDRFRSLPMNRAVVLFGRTLADLDDDAHGGRRHHHERAGRGLADPRRGCRSAAGRRAGLAVRLRGRMDRRLRRAAGPGAESAQAIGLTVLVPLSLTSNAFISTAGLTPWLRDVTNWNPISALAAACLQLLGNPDPAATIRSWPMQHPVMASALWSALIISVTAPLAVRLYIACRVGR